MRILGKANGRDRMMFKQKLKIAGCVLLLVAGLCGCKSQIESNDGASGIIGGADGPTTVVVGDDDGATSEITEEPEEDKTPEEGETPTEGETPKEEPQEEESEESLPLYINNYTPNEETLKVLGRAAFAENTLWMVHSGSGAEFQFTGTKAVITLQGDSSAYAGADNQARVGVFVNGECVADVMVDEKEKTLTVWESEKRKHCVVTVVKLSESPHSTAGIRSIQVESEAAIVPTLPKEHFIEFIGDSITCGYGVEDENRDHHFSTTTENAMKTYAYKTAQALDADYSLVSFSGYGIISGYSWDGVRHEDQMVSNYYEKLGFSYASYLGQTPHNLAWDFEKRQPDLIVINLGTNDESYTGTDQARRDEFVEGYVAFLKQVREKNPNAMIFATLGIMGDGLYPSVQKAVEQYQTETGDEKVHVMRFAVQSMSDGIAADWHPSEKTHIKAADKLTKEIQTVMGW